ELTGADALTVLRHGRRISPGASADGAWRRAVSPQTAWLAAPVALHHRCSGDVYRALVAGHHGSRTTLVHHHSGSSDCRVRARIARVIWVARVAHGGAL